MKAFEEWDSKLCQISCPLRQVGNETSCSACIVARKLGWKAALEWVLDKASELEYGDSIMPDIKKELEE